MASEKLKTNDSKPSPLAWVLFILRTMVLYSILGIAIGAVTAAIALWLAPKTAADAFGGEAWDEQGGVTWVGTVLVGIGGFSGFLFAIQVAFARVVIAGVLGRFRWKH
jgi:hypothetical protein